MFYEERNTVNTSVNAQGYTRGVLVSKTVKC